MKEKFLTSAFSGAFRFLAFWSRQQDRLSAFLEGLAMSAMSPRTLGKLTFAMYEDHPASAWRSEKRLTKWEEDWFRSDLPPSPANILLGGAGKGREVRALHERGYHVVAFDPVRDFVRQAPSFTDVTFLVGSYEDLAEPDTRDADRFCRAVEARAPYDAVLLGWGSFSHVPRESLRRALLVRLKELCPTGPLLASFFLEPDDHSPERRRLWKWGFRVGRALDPQQTLSPGPRDHFSSNLGFSHVFTQHDLEELAQAAGYRVSAWPKNSRDFPHATLRPLSDEVPQQKSFGDGVEAF